jgi:hypothetical protein
MAQHIPIELFKQKAIKKIEQGIRSQRYFRGSFKYEEVEKNIFTTSRRVPESIVFGGWASFEVHTIDGRKIEKIYLVA